MSRKPQGALPERQAFGLQIPRANDPRLRELRARHQPTQQGWRLWSSTWLLLSYLRQQPLAEVDVIDAGCGWGLAGVFCAAAGARVRSFDIDPEVLPIARFHAEVNDVSISTEARGFADIDADRLTDVGWLIGADICFRADLLEPLFELLRRAQQAGAAVAIADPGRAPFLSLADRCVRELDMWAGPSSTPEPLVAWPGERPLVHGRMIVGGAMPPRPDAPPHEENDS